VATPLRLTALLILIPASAALPAVLPIAAVLPTSGVLPISGPAIAQSVLAQLGLTEARARTFLFEEMKSQTPGNRRTTIAVTGHRAFYKLPASARGPAATALFAWARAYVDSPTFKSAYAHFRREATPLDQRAAPSADEQVASQFAEMQAGIEQARKIAATLPAADRDRLLAQLKAQEAQINDPAFRERIRAAVELEHRERESSNREGGARFDDQFPPDPNRLVARRLRAFLDDTADADFTARIIRLTDGPDGMEFVEPAHRAKSPTWQLAVLSGPEATKAARAAAETWLKDIAP
jgi:hypothetical protein